MNFFLPDRTLLVFILCLYLRQASYPRSSSFSTQPYLVGKFARSAFSSLRTSNLKRLRPWARFPSHRPRTRISPDAQAAPAHSTQAAVERQNIAVHRHKQLVDRTAAAAAADHRDEACTAQAQERRLSGSARQDDRTDRRILALVVEEGTARSGMACRLPRWGRTGLALAGRRMAGGGDTGEVVHRQALLRRQRGSEEGSVAGAQHILVQSQVQAPEQLEQELVLAQCRSCVRYVRNAGHCGSELLEDPVHRNEQA